MIIVNSSVNVKISTEYQTDLELLLSKLESASFADECRYEIKNFGRRFCCIFVTNGQYSKEYCEHLKNLSMLVNNTNILENKSKEIDYSS